MPDIGTEHIEIAQPEETATSQAELLRQEIYRELGEACVGEFALEQKWTRVGSLIARFNNGDCWAPLGYESFDAFLHELRVKFNRGKTQLRAYMGVAEKLLPVFGEQTLEEIGISKAQELKRAMKKNGGKPIPQDIIDAARKQQTTIKEIRAMLAQAFNLPPDEKGTWMDTDGFYVTPEERKEFYDAVRTTATLLNLGPDIPDHIKRKDIIFAWLREFVGTHRTEVFGPQEMQNTPATLMLPRGAA